MFLYTRNLLEYRHTPQTAGARQAYSFPLYRIFIFYFIQKG